VSCDDRDLHITILLVRGLASDLLSEAGAPSLLAVIPGTEMVSVEGNGHMVAGDRNDLFNDAVVGFPVRDR
jgi:pimeloyl-ACP methyl ester carboxylesterase